MLLNKECLIEQIVSTKEVPIPKDPFARVIGQDHAVRIIKSAILQKRHLLLCGEPGIGKSMLAKAAATLLPKPKEEIRVQHNSRFPERPKVIVKRKKHTLSNEKKAEFNSTTKIQPSKVYFVRPEELPVAVAVKMGFRCPICKSLSQPEQGICIECGAPKPCKWGSEKAYHALFRVLDVIHEKASSEVITKEQIENKEYNVVYTKDSNNIVRISLYPTKTLDFAEEIKQEEHILVPFDSTRFVQVSGASAVELLGDIKHDPYGGAETLGVPAYKRVIPGAIHEAHEGILYIDEIATLGPLQKHLLTAMQDKKYPITGHNPLSSGAAIRVGNVPCDFILIASSNFEDIAKILPPLRSRIKGYGYEVILNSWMRKTSQAVNSLVQFIAQTVEEDGRIPHFTGEAVQGVIDISEKIAMEFDNQLNALTLRLRELGGIIRIAGDLAVQDCAELTQAKHVQNAEQLVKENAVEQNNGNLSARQNISNYGNYFF